ncbi:MAG: hypothetical protein J6D21_11935 [Clostridia bacterium]|nr:hypothetical protein [Clostridia bacterium]
MFSSVYKATIKNLFRAVLFWLVLAFLLGFNLYGAMRGGEGSYSHDLGEMIWDTDPRFVFKEERYVQLTLNICDSVMLYAMPLFAIVSTILVLGHDYGDGFYEIERAGGRRPLCYLTGRLAALLTVNYLAVLVAMLLHIHVYVFSRGGVEGLTTGQYLVDSFVRILRNTVCIAWVPTTMFICLTYAFGTLFKNNWLAAAGSSVYVLINYLFNMQLKFRIPVWYREYLDPTPAKIHQYFRYFDHYAPDKFEAFLLKNETSLGLALACIGWILIMALIYSLVSYLRLRRREI